MTKLNQRKYYLALILFIFGLDKITKLLIKSTFAHDRYKTIEVIKNFANFIYTENKGAIWGIFQDYSKIITVVSVIALVVIFIYFFKIPRECKLELLAFSSLCGGALGNIFDRVFDGYVIDFIDVYVKKFHWATFNVADSFISIGIVLLIISIIFNRCPVQKISDKEKENAPNIN